MTINRRQFLAGGSAVLVSTAVNPGLTWAADGPAVAALNKSSLIYLTPIVSNGKESHCHGEVWFVHHESEVFVSTQAGAWRAEAVRRGFARARIWIGEFGVWRSAKDSYRSAPVLELEGRLETDDAINAQVLTKFGVKYASGWDSWGPRFRNGLADGSRVMLRYTIAS